MPYKESQDTKPSLHVRKRLKKNIKRTNRRLRKRKEPRKKSRTSIKGKVLKLEDIPGSKLKNTVINLSDKVKELTPQQLYLFYLEESFAPTPSLPGYSQFRLDILQFCYRLRWAWYFYKNPPKAKTSEVTTKELAIKEIEQKLVKKKETKAIQFCNNPCLELYIQQVSKELLQTNSNRTSVVPDNIPKEVREALQETKKWKDVVIRPADKGSKFFLLDRCDLC